MKLIVKKSCIEQVLCIVTEAKYETLYNFMDELLNIHSQQISSQV